MKSSIHVSLTISVAFHMATRDNARDNVDGPALSQLAYEDIQHIVRWALIVFAERMYWHTLLSYSRNCMRIVCTYVCYYWDVGDV